jgi:hypothetical protein
VSQTDPHHGPTRRNGGENTNWVRLRLQLYTIGGDGGGAGDLADGASHLLARQQYIFDACCSLGFAMVNVGIRQQRHVTRQNQPHVNSTSTK